MVGLKPGPTGETGGGLGVFNRIMVGLKHEAREYIGRALGSF